jgi:glycosyltransferase involved in cell wall biosynthesis
MTNDEALNVMRENKICVVVPTYNNGGTIADVLSRITNIAEHVILVVDGSTDDTLEKVRQLNLPQVEVLDYLPNRGKGHALAVGFRRAMQLGYNYAVTIDSDGQHYPEDMPALIAGLKECPGALIVGSRNLQEKNMPGGNTFANKFSNFWFTVQTGMSLPDTQTGYRIYPLRRLPSTRLLTSRYEAELLLLVLSAWKGIPLKPVPVRVLYQPEGERVSHFRPVADFARISVLNTVLCILAVCYGWPRMLLTKLIRKI